ncbi:IS30 family transposase [Aestuariicella hydrocarbonica]|uniref:IS30 family transposase n=1 Tax=Pseudomaricurvus hydrocarbonicus TaxID=1470433 RepID=A0A9E5MM18_9GAMM|nr:IS30 family transposase [Aestuariicella hydrocarbonica]NHO66038.1 IS30 family transposase [Aestuariicella hydrocarbonica]
MKQRKRIFYTAEQRALMWDRYHKGDSLADIARLFDRYHSSIEQIIAETGGIRPPERKRAKRSLSLSEREEISRGLVAQESVRSIAVRLSRSPSTISREINRNGGCQYYRASQADKAAWERAKRPKSCKLLCNKPLSQMVAKKLKRRWSPQQISGWLKRIFSSESFYVSHETIYKTLYIQARGALKKELVHCLRTQRVKRRSKHSSRKGLGQGKIVDAVPISERPASIEDRAIPGHWEGDLIEGCNNSYVATLVERHTRYVMLLKLKDKKTATVIAALIKQSKQLPSELYKSLTWDRGCEMNDHKEFTVATDIQIYLCDPQSPWQRGSNENTNRLLRQYLPKGTDLSVHSQAKLNAIARQLNERPRKTLDYESPADRFNACVAATERMSH